MSKQKVTAYIYDKKGKLLAVGHNSYTKTHPKQAYFASKAGVGRKTYLHAEIAALIRVGKNSGHAYRIHVERRLRNGTLGCSKPCSVCTLAIQEAGIKIVSYSI